MSKSSSTLSETGELSPIEQERANEYSGIWAAKCWRPLRRFRCMMRLFLSELIGTACITFFGPGVGCLVSFTGTAGDDWMAVTIVWALGVMVGVYAAAPSGAHLNPAVTLTFAIFEDFEWTQVPIYMLAQMLGGILGALVCYGLNARLIAKYSFSSGGPNNCNINPQIPVDYSDWPKVGSMEWPDVLVSYDGADTSGAFITWRNPWISFENAFCIEVVLTALLLFGILSVGKSKGIGDNGLGGFFVMLIVLLIGTAFGAQTGYALNPARDLGPRIMLSMVGCENAATIFTGQDNYFLVPLFAPMIGGPIGGALHYMTMHTP